MLVGELDQRVLLLAVLRQIRAHRADELAAGIRPRLQRLGDLEHRVIDVLEIYLVDVGVIDAIDVERAQRIVVGYLERLVMLVAQAFEEIHVHDGGAGGDHAVHHVVAHQFGIGIHAAGRAGRSGDDEEDRAVLVLQHLVVDARRAGKIAAGEAHLAHRIDDRTRIEALDVDMLDFGREQFGLARVVQGSIVHFGRSSWGHQRATGRVSSGFRVKRRAR